MIFPIFSHLHKMFDMNQKLKLVNHLVLGPTLFIKDVKKHQKGIPVKMKIQVHIMFR
jgi:hypothetical protein